jgi:hypothetical protein
MSAFSKTSMDMIPIGDLFEKIEEKKDSELSEMQDLRFPLVFLKDLPYVPYASIKMEALPKVEFSGRNEYYVGQDAYIISGSEILKGYSMLFSSEEFLKAGTSFVIIKGPCIALKPKAIWKLILGEGINYLYFLLDSVLLKLRDRNYNIHSEGITHKILGAKVTFEYGSDFQDKIAAISARYLGLGQLAKLLAAEIDAVDMFSGQKINQIVSIDELKTGNSKLQGFEMSSLRQKYKQHTVSQVDKFGNVSKMSVKTWARQNKSYFPNHTAWEGDQKKLPSTDDIGKVLENLGYSRSTTFDEVNYKFPNTSARMANNEKESTLLKLEKMKENQNTKIAPLILQAIISLYKQGKHSMKAEEVIKELKGVDGNIRWGERLPAICNKMRHIVKKGLANIIGDDRDIIRFTIQFFEDV